MISSPILSKVQALPRQHGNIRGAGYRWDIRKRCLWNSKAETFPETIISHTEDQLDDLLVETNSSYIEAVNECVRIFRNGLADDSNEELEILKSKLLSARVIRQERRGYWEWVDASQGKEIEIVSPIVKNKSGIDSAESKSP
jgi:hypothetical protein